VLSVSYINARCCTVVQDSAVSVLEWDTTNKTNKYMVDNPFLVRTPSTTVVDMQGSSLVITQWPW